MHTSQLLPLEVYELNDSMNGVFRKLGLDVGCLARGKWEEGQERRCYEEVRHISYTKYILRISYFPYLLQLYQ